MTRPRLTVLPALVGLLALLGLVVVPAQSAYAASAGWADVTFDGSANDWTGTVRQRATGFPAATIVSDSAGGSAVGRQSGASTSLSASTPVGEVYGSSRGRPYLNLRPRTANGSGVPGTSTTTYTFAAPTPASGWTFVLGDVDADAVTVSATGPGGVRVDADDLGFRSVFNYCGPGVCTANDDVPRWDGAGTLTGNPGAVDTNGASAWFEPRVPLETLTFVFARRAGFPVYQTWFAAQSHALSGRVDAPAAVREGLEVELFAPDGRVVGRTTTDAGGRYDFGDLATYAGYRVALVRPAGYTSDDPLSRTVDLSSADRVADFSLRAIVPSAVTGTVRTPDGDPVPGVTVTLTAPGGGQRTVVTGADGGYVLDEIEVGEGYTLTVTPPAGTTTSGPLTFDVPPDSEAPIEGRDFTITPQPTGTAGGTVRVEGSGPVSGVRVVVTGADRVERVATTDGDGRWSLDGLPPGAYRVAVEAPDGTTVVGDATIDATVPDDGGTVAGLDFVLSAPAPVATFTADGTVRDEAGMAFPGVDVEVADSTGQVFATTTTDETGAWSVDGLPADGDWAATVIPPDGYEAQDGDTVDFDATDASGLDFVLARKTGSGGDGGSDPADGSAAGSGSASPVLAQTGGPDLALLLLGLGATAGAVVLLRRPSTRRG